MERLPVADPERVEGRVGREFRRGGLAQLQVVRVGGHDVDLFEQDVFPGPNGHSNRSGVVVDRQVLASCNAVGRQVQGDNFGVAAGNGRMRRPLRGRAVALAVRPQQANHAALDGQLGPLDVGGFEDDVKYLLQVEIHADRGVLERVRVGHADPRHGNHDGIGRRLGHIDVAAASMIAPLAVGDHVPVAKSQNNRHLWPGRFRGGRRLGFGGPQEGGPGQEQAVGKQGLHESGNSFPGFFLSLNHMHLIADTILSPHYQRRITSDAAVNRPCLFSNGRDSSL